VIALPTPHAGIFAAVANLAAAIVLTFALQAAGQVGSADLSAAAE
jgi:hypothetical protein